MNDDHFEKLLEELQRKIEYDEEETYSKVVIREYRNPSNFGVIENPDALGEVKGPCGDTMKMSLRIEDRKIRDACFWTDGCGATIACGSMLTKMIKGENLEEAADITSERLIDALEGLPEEHIHCSKLAVDTLQNAIENYHKKKNSENLSL
ncbi:iron-sulfur cluster biosynthesis protein, NifU-like protein [Thermoplasmatales archaeon SCGC AB-540-F20]|nr:iron-sulfur cluster biosynthesis protein, NifU-like protein [Thermoplasmatales archaeon SCGC AB-540-F20]